MAKIFDMVKVDRPGRNTFDLRHDHKFTCNMGELVPCMVLEALPGDKFDIKAESLIRFAPLVSPVMHRMDVTIHYFFVPNRILWDGWDEFITPGNESLPPFPVISFEDGGPFANGRLANFMGIPNMSGNSSEVVNALPFAGYQCIWNEFYRDQNLIDPIDYKLANGDNTAAFATKWGVLRKRAWEHDYFTSALPTAQAGNQVSIPLGDVELKDNWDAHGTPDFLTTDDTIAVGNPISQLQSGIQSGPNNPVAYDPDGTLEVQPTTITDLRRATKLQEFLEKALRGGRRLVETLQVFFGVKTQDSRFQRPEYITGTKTPVQISEVLNTSATATEPQGNMAGHGVAVVNGRAGSFYCPEHGYIIGILSVMPKTAYQQGLPKHFLKTNDPYQYYWPQFAHIGEQPIEQREIFAGENGGDTVFGYTPRYAEYKYIPNRVSGQFQTTLEHWHLGRIFTSPPSLNQAFVECVPDTRIFAVDDPEEDHLWIHVYNEIWASRLMPKFGNPQF